MTKHDEVRQVLHDTGFKFNDGRSALEMTDEEVNQWVVHFFAVMSDFGKQWTNAMRSLTTAMITAIEPLKDLGRLLEEDKSRDNHGV